ncbi:kinase-like domain-containing protein [Lactarius quietus]|nr:kinase-like domain-containing protein [Lactarius quietus]
MEVDTHTRCQSSDVSSDEEASDWDSYYFVNQAPTRELLRLKKCRLQELHQSAGLSDDPESLTKHEIVDAIVAARDDLAELPPSSPYGANSSGYSSDDGNIAGGEETDAGSRRRSNPGDLRRHVTVHDVGHVLGPSPQRGRSFSLGHTRSSLIGGGEDRPMEKRRRTGSLRSSPTTSTASVSLPSPPATRLRSRKLSEEDAPLPSSLRVAKSRGKTKQVEFNEQVQIACVESLSDLTELSDTERYDIPTKPSPRRLRSQGERIAHTPPKRKGKNKATTFGEDGDMVDEEVDELLSSRDAPRRPTVNDRTPVKRRLRPRPIQTHTPPDESDDGDDEGGEEGEMGEVERATEEDGASVGEIEEEEEEDIDEAEEENDTTLEEPRKLRNGKIVGEDEDSDSPDEPEQEASDESAQEVVPLDEEIDLEVEDDESDESSHEDFMGETEDVDLTIATAKSLVRLRRDDLVRLCESRDLSVDGTKPRLAEALLLWRDRQSEASSPSSAGTIRPPSTTRPRRRGGSKSKSTTPPVLLRTHVHLDEPRTPPLSSAQREREEELELDLESLGLEDREIPPDKLTKLEKIGSGGFKDVFIGKFRGRRVAIAEFRGHLTSMDIKELKLLGGFNHANIVRFLGVSIPEDTRVTPVMIVSELCSNGDLFDYIRNVVPPSLYRVLSIMLDVARGLDYLHQRKPSVIHRDCKSSNILITSKGVAKIADFGLAKVKQSTRSMVRSLVGTVNWQAPELWHPHPKYNHKVDVFACGAVYWEMLQWHLPNKKYPWEGMNEHAIYEAVGSKRQRPSVSGLRKQWCPEIVDLIERMWAQEHHDRPTMTEVVTEVEELVRMSK